jgi:hypothetical protein
VPERATVPGGDRSPVGAAIGNADPSVEEIGSADPSVRDIGSAGPSVLYKIGSAGRNVLGKTCLRCTMPHVAWLPDQPLRARRAGPAGRTARKSWPDGLHCPKELA